MEIQARYFARMKDGRLVFVCSHHLAKIATRPDESRRLYPRRQVRYIGSLSQYTARKCLECGKGQGGML